MADPFDEIVALHGLGAQARRERWSEGAAAWRAMGNPEQALCWARLGGDPAATSEAEAAWAPERARQQAQLAANFAAASTRRAPPALPELVWNEARDLARGVSWVSRDGRTDLVVFRNGVPGLLPLAVSPQVEEGLRDLASKGEPFLLAPMASARLVGLALAAQPTLFLTMRPALFLVEPSLGVFRMLARLSDLTKPLEADQVLWFIGEGWASRLSGFLRAYPGIPVPRLKAILGRSLPEAEPGRVLDAALDWREGEARRLEGEALRLYASRSAQDWRAAFAEGGRPKVLLLTSRFTTVLQYVIRDLEQAFRALGCEALTLIEKRDCEWSVLLEARQRIVSFRPDLVVQLDHLRPEFGGTIPPAIPYACWIQDRLPWLFERRHVEALGPRDLTFAMWPAIREECLRAGYREVHPLPVAGNAFVYRLPERVPPEALRCEVAFVSNVQAPRPLPAYPGLVEEAERVLRAEGIGYRDPAFYERLLERLEKSLGLRTAERDRPGLLSHLSFDIERWVQRTEPLRWARAMGLYVRVYGKGWGESGEFSGIWGGSVAPGEPLRDLYAASRIHLHMNSDTNVHARVFECLLSGGFVLAWAHPSDARPGGLGEMLEIGREVMTFSGRADFEGKVGRALSDEAQRRKVSEAGRIRTLAEHTTVHRAREILSRVRDGLAREGQPPRRRFGPSP